MFTIGEIIDKIELIFKSIKDNREILAELITDRICDKDDELSFISDVFYDSTNEEAFRANEFYVIMKYTTPEQRHVIIERLLEINSKMNISNKQFLEYVRGLTLDSNEITQKETVLADSVSNDVDMYSEIFGILDETTILSRDKAKSVETMINNYFIEGDHNEERNKNGR